MNDHLFILFYFLSSGINIHSKGIIIIMHTSLYKKLLNNKRIGGRQSLSRTEAVSNSLNIYVKCLVYLAAV